MIRQSDIDKISECADKLEEHASILAVISNGKSIDNCVPDYRLKEIIGNSLMILKDIDARLFKIWRRL